ncbi:translocation protein Sec62-domain-containing protein, partial [Circinella umbellata]
APPFYKATAEFLRDTKKSGLKMRQGVFNGKRVEYFKGKSGVNGVLKEGFAKVLPKDREPVTTREDAIKVMNDLGKHGFILRVNRGDNIGGKGSARVLQPNPQQELKDDGYYMWIYEGSQLKLYLYAALLVVTVLAAVLFPLWPESLRLGVWYLSVGVLGLLGVFFGIAIVRLILYIITIVILPRGIWIFPNLFEDVGIIDSFIPFWAWDEPSAK